MVMVCMYEQRSAGEPQALNVMQQIKVLQTGAFFDGWLSLFFSQTLPVRSGAHT